MRQKRNQSPDAATVGGATMARPRAEGARPLKAQEEVIELPTAISSCSVERGRRNGEEGGENHEKNSPETIHSLRFPNTFSSRNPSYAGTTVVSKDHHSGSS